MVSPQPLCLFSRPICLHCYSHFVPKHTLWAVTLPSFGRGLHSHLTLLLYCSRKGHSQGLLLSGRDLRRASPPFTSLFNHRFLPHHPHHLSTSSQHTHLSSLILDHQLLLLSHIPRDTTSICIFGSCFETHLDCCHLVIVGTFHVVNHSLCHNTLLTSGAHRPSQHGSGPEPSGT